MNFHPGGQASPLVNLLPYNAKELGQVCLDLGDISQDFHMDGYSLCSWSPASKLKTSNRKMYHLDPSVRRNLTWSNSRIWYIVLSVVIQCLFGYVLCSKKLMEYIIDENLLTRGKGLIHHCQSQSQTIGDKGGR